MREEYVRYRAEEVERNKQAKEENKKYKEAEEERLLEGDSSNGFLSGITFANVLSLVGIGLTVYALFFKKEEKPRVVWKEPVETTMESKEEKKEKAKPRLKFGM